MLVSALLLTVTKTSPWRLDRCISALSMHGKQHGTTMSDARYDRMCARKSGKRLQITQLFQLRLSLSKAEKLNTSAKGLLGIAKNSLAIPSKPFALVCRSQQLSRISSHTYSLNLRTRKLHLTLTRSHGCGTIQLQGKGKSLQYWHLHLS